MEDELITDKARLLSHVFRKVEFFVEFIEYLDWNFIQIQRWRKSGECLFKCEAEESVIPVHGFGVAHAQSRKNQVIVDDFDHLSNLFYWRLVLVQSQHLDQSQDLFVLRNLRLALLQLFEVNEHSHRPGHFVANVNASYWCSFVSLFIKKLLIPFRVVRQSGNPQILNRFFKQVQTVFGGINYLEDFDCSVKSYFFDSVIIYCILKLVTQLLEIPKRPKLTWHYVITHVHKGSILVKADYVLDINEIPNKILSQFFKRTDLIFSWPVNQR